VKKNMILRWLPVALGIAATVGLLIFGFIPFSRNARQQSRQADAVAVDLQKRLTLLTDLPQKQSELDSLRSRLEEFRNALRRTDEVDNVMSAFETRALAANVSFWQLDPSLPTLVSLEQAKDSVAALDLALLPLRFECRGRFVDVGRFLESEEQRSEFCQWTRLTLAPEGLTGRIRATGEILLFLLPEEKFTEGVS
jgi:hypothetical protein